MNVVVAVDNILGPRTPTRRMEGIMNNAEHAFYKCGGKGHWSHTCRSTKYLVKLYQKSKLKSNIDLVDKLGPGKESIYVKDTT